MKAADSIVALDLWPKHFGRGKAAFAFASLFLANASVFAQEVPAGISAPTYSLTDPNGINLVSNKPTASFSDVSIGDDSHPLGHAWTTIYEQPNQPSPVFVDTYRGRILPPYLADPSNCPGSNSTLDVSIAGSADRMCGTLGGSYVSQRKTGTTIATNGDGTLTYTTKDGTRYTFTAAWLTQIANPDGRISTLTYKTGNVGSTTWRRLQSVTRNDGLQIKYSYASNSLPGSGYPTSWLQVANIRAINNAVDYCDPQADTCTFSQSWPSAMHIWTTSGSVRYYTVTDSGGRATRFTLGIPVLSGGNYQPNFQAFTSEQLLAVRAPTSTSADTVSYTFCAPQGEYYCMKAGVKSVTTDGVAWTYSGTSGTGGPSVFIQLTSTRLGGATRGVTMQIGNYAQGQLLSFGDGILQKTFYFESALSNRLASVLSADGYRLTYAYDDRSNITSETRTPAAGSPLQATSRTANYDETCTNPVTCNRPNWIRDARGNQTDFKWDPVHGGATSVTSPPDLAGVRPQVRYTYAQQYAWYKNSSGTVVQASSPIWVRTAEKYCRTSAALQDGSGCSSPGDEVATTYEYGPTGAANNLFLRGKAVTADGVTLRTCYGNDKYGNRISETLPKAGLSSCP